VGSQVSRRVAKLATDFPPQQSATSLVSAHSDRFFGSQGSVSNHGHVNLDDPLVWGKDRFGWNRAVQLQSRERPESARPARSSWDRRRWAHHPERMVHKLRILGTLRISPKNGPDRVEARQTGALDEAVDRNHRGSSLKNFFLSVNRLTLLDRFLYDAA
jgi:hypothetical protein